MQYLLHLLSLSKVINISEELLCSLFCPKQLHISQANTLGWHIFKQLIVHQGVDKLTPAYSGCPQVQDGKLLSLLTNEASAPEAALQVIRCNCISTNVESTSKCSRRSMPLQTKQSSVSNCAEHRANRNLT